MPLPSELAICMRPSTASIRSWMWKQAEPDARDAASIQCVGGDAAPLVADGDLDFVTGRCAGRREECATGRDGLARCDFRKVKGRAGAIHFSC